MSGSTTGNMIKYVYVYMDGGNQMSERPARDLRFVIFAISNQVEINHQPG